MDQCTHDIRSEQWKSIIQACQQRPEGQSAKQWMDEHHILEQSYYYWLRKFRNEAFQQLEQSNLPATQNMQSEITFAEIGHTVVPEPIAVNHSEMGNIHPSAVIKTERLSIAISNDITESLLARILQEVTHA